MPPLKKSEMRKRNTPSRVHVMRKALGHPYRIKALSILAERVASPREIADAIGIDLDNLSYHIRVLRELEMIELVREEKVRGATSHFYRAILKPYLDDDEWEKLDADEQAVFLNFTFTLLAGDLDRSIASENWMSRPDSHLTRTPMALDEPGWAEISQILFRTFEDIHQAHMKSIKRTKGESAAPVRAIVGMMLFEAAPPV